MIEKAKVISEQLIEWRHDFHMHHDPRFGVDDRCLPIGVAVLAEAALHILRENLAQGMSGAGESKET